eukprot:128271-Prymnesium_polylepis.1
MRSQSSQTARRMSLPCLSHAEPLCADRSCSLPRPLIGRRGGTRTLRSRRPSRRTATLALHAASSQ